jgi:hypothetical protein
MKGDSGMNMRRRLALAAVLGLAVTGCDYIVPPYEPPHSPTPPPAGDWGGVVTNVTEAGGALHVDLAIINETNDFSAMDVAKSKARVIDAAGKKSDCDTVFFGTSVFVNGAGWYIPRGFIMKGYTGGSVEAPKTQPLFAECAGVSKSAAKTLEIDYSFVKGAYDYYSASDVYNKTMKLDLTEIAADTKYPVAQTVADFPIEKPGDAIPAINQFTLRLIGVKRTETGFEFTWETTNPSEYPNYMYIGNPPVLGADGILYGFYQTPHLVKTPITPANGGKTTWTTEVGVPSDASGFYIIVPVETKQNKYWVDYVVDITAGEVSLGSSEASPSGEASPSAEASEA